MQQFLRGSLVSLLPMVYLQKYPGYNDIVFWLPLVYGIIGVVIAYFGNYLLGGMLVGLVLSLVGRFVLDIPRQTFPEYNNYRVHIIAMVLYSFVYYILRGWLKPK